MPVQRRSTQMNLFNSEGGIVEDELSNDLPRKKNYHFSKSHTARWTVCSELKRDFDLERKFEPLKSGQTSSEKFEEDS